MSTNHVIIPSKGRPHCATAQYLSDICYPSGFTILLGDDDESVQDYLDRWGSEHVLVFDKRAAMECTDLMDAFGDSAPSGVSPARNMVAKVARGMGLERVWMFDDDYKMVSVTHSDNSREQLLDGKRLFDELDKIERFGISTEIPVVGFGFNSVNNAAQHNTKRGNHVYNGFNIDVREGHFIPFSGRLFEDGTHTMTTMRMGKTDFCFYHIYITPDEQMYMFNKKKSGKQQGGLHDTYGFFAGDDELSMHNNNQCRNVGYPLMQAPIASKIVVYKNNPRLGKEYDSRHLQVKVLSDSWKRL